MSLWYLNCHLRHFNGKKNKRPVTPLWWQYMTCFIWLYINCTLKDWLFMQCHSYVVHDDLQVSWSGSARPVKLAAWKNMHCNELTKPELYSAMGLHCTKYHSHELTMAYYYSNELTVRDRSVLSETVTCMSWQYMTCHTSLDLADSSLQTVTPRMKTDY